MGGEMAMEYVEALNYAKDLGPYNSKKDTKEAEDDVRGGYACVMKWAVELYRAKEGTPAFARAQERVFCEITGVHSSCRHVHALCLLFPLCSPLLSLPTTTTSSQPRARVRARVGARIRARVRARARTRARVCIKGLRNIMITVGNYRRCYWPPAAPTSKLPSRSWSG